MSQAFQLTLIRHAQSANNALPESRRIEDPPITALGEQQVQSLAERFRGEPVTHCLTSGFRRAVQTMAPVAEVVGRRPAIWTDLHEVGGCFAGFEYGQLEGRPGMNREDLQSEFPEFDIPDDIDELGWWKSRPYEQYDQARSRAEAQAKRLEAEFKDSSANVVCVIHADFKALMLEQLGVGTSVVLAQDLYNTGVTKFGYTDGKFELLQINDVSHLSEPLVSS